MPFITVDPDDANAVLLGEVEEFAVILPAKSPIPVEANRSQESNFRKPSGKKLIYFRIVLGTYHFEGQNQGSISFV